MVTSNRNCLFNQRTIMKLWSECFVRPKKKWKSSRWWNRGELWLLFTETNCILFQVLSRRFSRALSLQNQGCICVRGHWRRRSLLLWFACSRIWKSMSATKSTTCLHCISWLCSLLPTSGTEDWCLPRDFARLLAVRQKTRVHDGIDLGLST